MIGKSMIKSSTWTVENLFKITKTRFYLTILCNENSDKFVNTGRERLIRSHSSARFCFELSGNSN